jgi:hypothetical protein
LCVSDIDFFAVGTFFTATFLGTML